jgi:hypothetical protein
MLRALWLVSRVHPLSVPGRELSGERLLALRTGSVSVVLVRCRTAEHPSTVALSHDGPSRFSAVEATEIVVARGGPANPPVNDSTHSDVVTATPRCCGGGDAVTGVHQVQQSMAVWLPSCCRSRPAVQGPPPSHAAGPCRPTRVRLPWHKPASDARRSARSSKWVHRAVRWRAASLFGDQPRRGLTHSTAPPTESTADPVPGGGR